MSKNYPRGIEDVEIIRPETVPQTVPNRTLYIRSLVTAILCSLLILVMGWFFPFYVMTVLALTGLMCISLMNIFVYQRAGKMKTIDPDWENTEL